jgi:Zn-finger protein
MVDCIYCNKPLKLIGNERKGGKSINNSNGKDWSSRKYHKKCWKHIKDIQDAWLLGLDYEYSPEEYKKAVERFKTIYNLEKLL